MSENYPGLRKPMTNGLFRHARGCFLLKFRIYWHFQKNTPENTKKLIQLLCWWNQSKSVNVERPELYFIIGAFIKLLNSKKIAKKHAHSEINMAHGNIQIKHIFFLIISCSKIFFLLFYFQRIFSQKTKFERLMNILENRLSHCLHHHSTSVVWW